MRFMATVTISVREALMASAISVLLRNLPVPRKRRELKVRLAMVSMMLEMFLLLGGMVGRDGAARAPPYIIYRVRNGRLRPFGK